MSKKKFKDSTVGKMLLGAAGLINPTLGSVLQGITSPQDAIAEITKADISQDDKIKLQQLIYDQQTKEMNEISSRWKADMSANGSWLTKNVRPLVLVWCIVIFSLAGILDSVESIPFQINELWGSTFENIMMTCIISYFGSRGLEKSTSLFKNK
jgi:hypothetical protein